MRELLRFPVRVSAFLGKEVFEVLRQPRLVVTLILGPFLILLLVGVGYRNEPRVLRTLFVAHDDETAGLVETYASNLSPSLVYSGVVRDDEEGKQHLRRGEVDLLVIAPGSPESALESNEQATFQVYHNEIDPLQASYVEFVGQFFVEEFNRRVLRNLTQEGQVEAAGAKEDLAKVRQSGDLLLAALESGNEAEARTQRAAYSNDLDQLDLAVGASAAVLAGLAGAQGSEPDAETQAILDKLSDVRERSAALGDVTTGCASCAQQAQQVREIQERLDELETTLTKFENVSPEVVVSPFRSEAHSILPVQPRMIDFFAPTVLALLLQHLSVTFAALSIVRERRLGTTELFRVSPLLAVEALVGKYLSNLMFGGTLAAVLTALLVYGLGVPMLGRWGDYVLIMASLLFTSLGMGFVISLSSQTESQAVQYSMLVLLAAIFLGGLFVSPYLLWEPVRAISWLLPVTYGMNLLQEVMLRGVTPNWLYMTGLVGLGVVLLLVAWVQLRRLLQPR